MLLAGLVLVVLGGACSSGTVGSGSAGSNAPGRVNASSTTAARPPAGTEPVVGGRGRLTGFKEVTVTIVDADGRSRTVCLLLADTATTREQGLMYVEDPALGGYDGMLFVFEEDSTNGFWMKNTKLPLSIVYLRADGSTVSTTDMEPCPASTTSCPSYPAAGAYRSTIEVPKGRLPDLGISDRSRVTVGAGSCSPRPGSA